MEHCVRDGQRPMAYPARFTYCMIETVKSAMSKSVDEMFEDGKLL